MTQKTSLDSHSMNRAFLSVVILFVTAFAFSADGAERTTVETLPLPGHPFGVAASADGYHLFVALTAGDQPGIAVIRRGSFELQRVVPIAGPTGIALSTTVRT